MEIICRHEGNEYRQNRGEQALAAALVHDLGHGPFSHAFEDVGKRLGFKLASGHEAVSDALIRDGEVADALNKLGSGFATDVANVIKRGPVDIYSAVVSSQFDADRLDYIQRDRLMTGTQHSEIDFIWLTANLKIGEIGRGVDEEGIDPIKTFLLGPKAYYAAEAYVLGLFQLYPTVYFHKATRSAEKIFSELLYRLVMLIRNGNLDKTGLPSAHPIVQFAKSPDDTGSILSLDDTVVWGALSLMANGEDKIVAEFSERLRDRKLFKSKNVRGIVRRGLTANDDDLSDELEEAVSKACTSIGEEIARIKLEGAGDVPSLLWDEAERLPYKELDESKGPLNQITIETNSGDLVDLRKVSTVVRAIKPFRLARAYIREDDHESDKLLSKLIDKELQNAKR